MAGAGSEAECVRVWQKMMRSCSASFHKQQATEAKNKFSQSERHILQHIFEAADRDDAEVGFDVLADVLDDAEVGGNGFRVIGALLHSHQELEGFEEFKKLFVGVLLLRLEARVNLPRSATETPITRTQSAVMRLPCNASKKRKAIPIVSPSQEVVEVKVEESDGVAVPLDPFPSAVVYVDEDMDRDMREAVKSATPVVSSDSSLCQTAIDAAKQTCMPAAPSVTLSTAGSLHTTWTVYTELATDGPKCFVPETQFLRVDGSAVSVCDLWPGEELQGPGRNALVQLVVPHAQINRNLIGLSIRMASDELHVSVTNEHRLTLQNGGYKRACDLKPGDLLFTSEGECTVTASHAMHKNTAVFEVTFAEDRPVYMALSGAFCGMAAAFGSEQIPPYDPADFVEFRFKGQICNSTFCSETWLSQAEFQGRFCEFDMKFWHTRAFAVWVFHGCADRFWATVMDLLPKGSKLYRRPVAVVSSVVPDGISTPAALTP